MYIPIQPKVTLNYLVELCSGGIDWLILLFKEAN